MEPASMRGAETTVEEVKSKYDSAWQGVFLVAVPASGTNGRRVRLWHRRRRLVLKHRWRWELVIDIVKRVCVDIIELERRAGIEVPWKPG